MSTPPSAGTRGVGGAGSASARVDLDADPVLALHRGGKIELGVTVPVETREDLSLAYTPGVARVCKPSRSSPHSLDWLTDAWTRVLLVEAARSAS